MLVPAERRFDWIACALLNKALFPMGFSRKLFVHGLKQHFGCLSLMTASKELWNYWGNAHNPNRRSLTSAINPWHSQIVLKITAFEH